MTVTNKQTKEIVSVVNFLWTYIASVNLSLATALNVNTVNFTDHGMVNDYYP